MKYKGGKMSIVDTAKDIKKIHPNDIALIKVGKFYYTYGKDAYIMSYMFGYQLKKADNSTNTTGFPEVALNKVIKKLEDKTMNYVLIDRSSNYDVIDTGDFKEKNNYSNVYNLAYRYVNRKNKVEAIYEYLVNNIDDDLIKEKLQQIEEILYE